MAHDLQLTTDHGTSSYGIPVLVDGNGNAYGPRDIIDGVEAWTLVTTDPSPLAEAFIRSANLQPHEVNQTRQPDWDMTCPQCGLKHSDLLPCDWEEPAPDAIRVDFRGMRVPLGKHPHEVMSEGEEFSGPDCYQQAEQRADALARIWRVRVRAYEDGEKRPFYETASEEQAD